MMAPPPPPWMNAVDNKGGMGEGGNDQPPPPLDEAAIEEELLRLETETHARMTAGSTTSLPVVGEDGSYEPLRPFKKDRTERKRCAVLDCCKPDLDLVASKRAQGWSGRRFSDSVRDLTGELSFFLRKTMPSGEVFPLPIDSALGRPPFSEIDDEVCEVVRGIVIGLNNLFDCIEAPSQKVSQLRVRIFGYLIQEAKSFIEKTGTFETLSWEDFFRVRSIDYKGDEVKTAQQTTWSCVSPALPSEVGTVALEDVVEGGCKDYVLHFERYLVPPEAQVYTKPPKVMVADCDWEAMCEGLLAKGVCGLMAESQLHHVQGRPLLNGLFGVLKEETHQGQPVHRLIMNLVPLNRLCKSITGDVSTLPAWPNMNGFYIQPGETLLISSEDVRCFFYLFKVPQEWRPFLGFAKRVPARLCPDEAEPYYLTSLVLPMGFSNSVALAQHIHRVVVGRALREARRLGFPGGWEAELRKDRALTVSNPLYRVYLDNFDQLERVESDLAARIKGSTTPLVDSLRNTYQEMEIPRHPKKAVERQVRADVQGALVDGVAGTAIPRPEKITRYIQLSLLMLEEGASTQRQMQVVAGGLVYMAMFRRPLLGTLNGIWEFIQSFDDHQKYRQTIPTQVKGEIARFCLLTPLARMDFRTPFSGTVAASDASSTGGGVTASSGLTPVGCMAANCQVRGDIVESYDLRCVLTVGLFDGLGALRVAADAIGLPVVGHISVERHPPARRVVESRFPNSLFVEEVEQVDAAMVHEWVSFLASSHCHPGSGTPLSGGLWAQCRSTWCTSR